MSAAHIDVAEFDDTALGAEVRHKHAEGHAMLILHDSSVPDRRAGTWVDGTRGLYKLRCRNNHVWLSAVSAVGLHKQPFCTICGSDGESVEDA